MEAPFHLPAVEGPGGPRDAFTFWGWSPDSRHYAYELYYPGSGGADCDMRGELVIVDASKDAYAEEGYARFAYPSAEGPCTGPSPAEQADSQRSALLSKFDIQPTVEVVANSGGDADWVVEPVDLGFFRLTLTQTGSAEAQKAGYKLEMYEVGHAGMPKVIEAGTRHRDGVLRYSVHSVFFAPDDSHVAILIEKKQQDYEAVGTSYMTNAATMFPPWDTED